MAGTHTAAAIHILHYLKTNSRTGKELEFVTASTLRQQGYEVEITGKTADHGVDIIAVAPDGKKGIVQCKKKAWDNVTVGEPEIRDIIAASVIYKGLRPELKEEYNEFKIFVTTTTYTKPARKVADLQGVRLWDKEYLLEQFDEHASAILSDFFMLRQQPHVTLNCVKYDEFDFINHVNFETIARIIAINEGIAFPMEKIKNIPLKVNHSIFGPGAMLISDTHITENQIQRLIHLILSNNVKMQIIISKKKITDSRVKRLADEYNITIWNVPKLVERFQKKPGKIFYEYQQHHSLGFKKNKPKNNKPKKKPIQKNNIHNYFSDEGNDNQYNLNAKNAELLDKLRRLLVGAQETMLLYLLSQSNYDIARAVDLYFSSEPPPQQINPPSASSSIEPSIHDYLFNDSISPNQNNNLQQSVEYNNDTDSDGL
eukprot:137926_1